MSEDPKEVDSIVSQSKPTENNEIADSSPSKKQDKSAKAEMAKERAKREQLEFEPEPFELTAKTEVK